MSALIHLRSIADLYKLFGLEGLRHPLITVVDFGKATGHIEGETRLSGDFYSIMLKTYPKNNIKYGRKPIDFQDGSLICMAPGQVIEMDEDGETPATMRGWGLFFHGDLIRGSALDGKMRGYGFWSYEISEALHLSEKEKQILYDCVQKIEAELQENIDVHSQSIIVASIELLLNYCVRFYGRQFITRQYSNHSVVAQVEKILSDYFKQDEKVLPTVGFLAERVRLSPSYLSDLLKKETGKNAQDHIHFHLIEEAKSLLRSTDKSVAEIAYSLGFEYPQYFNKLFKQKMGKTPVEFRTIQ